MEKLETWKNSVGNICFSIPVRKMFMRPWIFILAATLTALICGAEFLVWDSYSLLVPAIILLLLFFLWWLDIPIRENSVFVSMAAYEIMGKFLDVDAKAVGVSVVNSMVNHDNIGTNGVFESSCLLVLLDNNEVWEYPLNYHKSDRHGAYFECERKFIVSENKEHIRKITPKQRRRFVSKFKLSDKAHLSLLLLAIFIIGGMCVTGFCWLMNRFQWWYMLIFVAFFVICNIIEWSYKKWPGKILNVARKILSVPIVFSYFYFKIGMPFIIIVATYFLGVLFAFGVPALILVELKNAGILLFHAETIVFVVITLGSIFCSNSYMLTKLIINFTPLRNKGDHIYESFKEQLVVYLIHPSNVVFLLYFVYFLFLGVSGYLQIQNNQYVISESFDAAILKAFLVYIAFSNMKIKSKESTVDIKELTKKTLLLFVNDK